MEARLCHDQQVDVLTSHAADRLLGLIATKRTPVCVGLDPVLERLPKAVLASHEDAVTAVEAFTLQVLEAVCPHVPCVKFQSACFERYGSRGVAALQRCIQAANRVELSVILDAKRGDIGISAAHYAAAAFDGMKADWVTINGYLGADGIEPFQREGHGAFVLVRTSNPSGDELQGAPLADGRSVADAVAGMVASIGESTIGASGYSSLGAVVGATKAADARRLRTLMPRQIFLIPGFGAQGGGVDDVLPCFNEDGRGGLVTASRSVIYAFEACEVNWSEAVGDAAASLAEEVGHAVGMR